MAVTLQFDTVNDPKIMESLLLQLREAGISGQAISFAYAPEVIEINGKKYLLHFPLRCLLEKADGTYIVKSEMLDIIGTGASEAEAKESFAREFDFIYHRYNELGETRLSSRLRRVKTILNQLVKSVE
jgi:hypothetical protein